jgi:hypothetical protein
MKSLKDWKEYRQIYGHCKVPQSSVDDELTSWAKELGAWVGTRQKTGTLRPPRKAKLDAIGLAWGDETKPAQHSLHDSCDLEDSEDEESLYEPGALIPSRKWLRRLARSNDR